MRPSLTPPFWLQLAPPLELKTRHTQDEPVALTVETFDTHVYFYSHVDTDRALALMRELRALDQRLRAEALTRNLEGVAAVPIWLHINSGGGDPFSAFAVADQIARLNTPVHTVIEGVGASAATIISVAGHRRFIQPNSYMLIHQFAAWFVGKYEEFKDEMRLQDMLIDRMATFYASHSKLSKEQMREKLKSDWWLDAYQALEVGLVDQVF